MDVALMLLSLCGPGHAALAPLVAREAARYEPHRPAILVAMARVESTCAPDVVGGKDGFNVGLLAIRLGTRAARGHGALEFGRLWGWRWPRCGRELRSGLIRRCERD